MSDARFLFAVSEGPSATVIDSQVVDPVVAVAREGVRFELLFLGEPRPWLAQRAFFAQRRRQIAARTGSAVRVVPVPQKHRRLGEELSVAILALELARTRARRLVVHGRGDFTAYCASRVARRHGDRLRYLYDARGDVEGELRLGGAYAGLSSAQTERVLQRQLARRQRAIDGAAHVLCVSTVLRDKLVAKHGLDPTRSSVVPCVADAEKFGPDEEQRRAMRRELGVDDRFVVVYPGRFGAWHYNEETFALVRALMDADPSVFFLVLTPDLDAARALTAKTLPDGRFEIRSVPHAEVPTHLRAADLGVLLRAPDPTNEVACPTKFAEYVMTGLPVLISAGIGDCSAFVAKHDTGAVLATPDAGAAIAAVARLRDEPDAARRARIAAVGQSLSRQRYAREMAVLYRRVAEER